MSSEAAVRIDGVAKRYRIGARDVRSFRESLRDFVTGRRADAGPSRDLWALDDVTFDVANGEAVGIVGRNGAGKSTLLKILSRITEPTRGEVRIRGRVSSLLEVGTGFHGELTGRENIALNGAILGMSRAEIRDRFDDIVAFAEIEKFIDTPVKHYSSGMYMRLAFAVAAHLEPEILIVDEVLAVGDSAFQEKCLRKMGDVATEGRTVLFVSHNMPAVKALCQRAVWLSEGRVAEIGPAGDVVDHYLRQTVRRADRGDVEKLIAGLPDDALFRLRDVRLRQHGQETSLVANGAPASLEVRFDVKKTTLGLQVWAQLYDSDGVLLFETIHNADSEAPPLMEAGSYTATMLLPPNLLAARQYQFHVGASLHNVRLITPQPVRIHFDVQHTGIVNRAYGSYHPVGRLAPHLDWRVERE